MGLHGRSCRPCSIVQTLLKWDYFRPMNSIARRGKKKKGGGWEGSSGKVESGQAGHTHTLDSWNERFEENQRMNGPDGTKNAVNDDDGGGGC